MTLSRLGMRVTSACLPVKPTSVSFTPHLHRYILPIYSICSPFDARYVFQHVQLDMKCSPTHSVDYAIKHNLTPFISMQNHYNAIYREEEREMMPVLKHFGVGSIPWSPLARGALCRSVSEQFSKGSGRISSDK